MRLYNILVEKVILPTSDLLMGRRNGKSQSFLSNSQMMESR